MPSSPPDGDPVGAQGPLEPGRRVGAPFGFYLHVPFCATRCGYCDFNTYTASESGGADPAGFVAAARAEIRAARSALELVAPGGVPPVATVFVGGGTPTLLGPGPLGELLGEIRDGFGLEPGAEITTEANPETVSPPVFEALLEAGFTRVSLGMQSSSPHVLATLDRVHTPGRAVAAAREARTAGFGQVSLDLIYGTPGESDADWRGSVEAALGAGPTHVSAYSLVVEDGTAMARRVRRGEFAVTEDDVLAGRYETADVLLSEAGLAWYEVSNWGAPCRHNLGYWRSNDWWGAGPGAHSHVAGVRWWNVRHPAAYATALAEGRLPAQAREVLDRPTRQVERVLLGVRLAEGHPVADLPPGGFEALPGLVADGLVDPAAVAAGRIALTLNGRLLADAVVRSLLP